MTPINKSYNTLIFYMLGILQLKAELNPTTKKVKIEKDSRNN